MQILAETKSRREYKTKWQAIKRATLSGLNMDLVDKFYAEMLRRGYGHELALAGLFEAAREGAFGIINKHTTKGEYNE